MHHPAGGLDGFDQRTLDLGLAEVGVRQRPAGLAGRGGVRAGGARERARDRCGRTEAGSGSRACSAASRPSHSGGARATRSCPDAGGEAGGCPASTTSLPLSLPLPGGGESESGSRVEAASWRSASSTCAHARPLRIRRALQYSIATHWPFSALLLLPFLPFPCRLPPSKATDNRSRRSVCEMPPPMPPAPRAPPPPRPRARARPAPGSRSHRPSPRPPPSPAARTMSSWGVGTRHY